MNVRLDSLEAQEGKMDDRHPHPCTIVLLFRMRKL
jgi:hypothetical protein